MAKNALIHCINLNVQASAEDSSNSDLVYNDILIPVPSILFSAIFAENKHAEAKRPRLRGSSIVEPCVHELQGEKNLDFHVT